VALVLVLFFLVLVAGLAVAFFTRTATERQISNANASGTKVELLAATSLDVIVSDMEQEITSSTNSTPNGTGTNTIYIPISGSAALPVRTGTIPNLICQSSRSYPASRAASSISTGTSLNGRSVSLPRWNLHYLLPLASGSAGDSTPSSQFTAPDWVIVTRNGPLQSATWSSTLQNASPNNTNYAIGRYAYAIYDEGGLLDVNAAGYPSITTPQQSGPKGGLAFADLTQLGVQLTGTQIDQIVGWRNYATAQASGTFPNFTFATSAPFVTQATSSSNCFLTFSGTTYNNNTDHAVMSRQQLIKLLMGIATTPAQQVQMQTALQYLGTFTREVNGPTWGPTVNYTAPYNYQASGTGTASTVYNPLIFNAKVSGTFTRGDGTVAVIGEPLVKNRFPLQKLALLQNPLPLPLPAQTADDIARYFGLDLVTTGTFPTNGYARHWNYPTTNPSYKHGVGLSGSTGIMSLNDVATQNREPDFFELLQAGILQGSLGVETLPGMAQPGVRGDAEPLSNASYYGSPAFVDPDSKITYQIMRVGANIIDQWGSDNYPTTITVNIPPGNNAPDSVYGIKDLPYFNEFFLRALSGTGGTLTQPVAPLTPIVYFELWNPHQVPSTSGSYPTSFQISPLVCYPNTAISDYYQTSLVVDTKNRWYWSGTWGSGNYQSFQSAPSQGIVQFTLANPATQFREPTVSGTIALTPIPSFPSGTMVSTPSGTMTWATAYATQKWNVDLNVSIVYRLQYMDSAGTPRTYSTFVGLDNPGAPLPGTALRLSSWVPANFSPYLTGTTDPFSWPKSDPRTFRFGSGANGTYPTNCVGTSLTPFAGSPLTSPISASVPFYATIPAITGTSPYRLDMWTVNNPAGGTFTGYTPYYNDPDGQMRPGDARYSYPSVSPLYSGTAGGTPGRPVILNRPFRSVGELAYAFRDDPWRTLDFFSSSSADAALLDLFTLNGNQPVLAGRLDPNTQQAPVLAAVISGATQSINNGTTVSGTNALTVANAIIALSGSSPFTNRADFVTRIMNDPSIANISNIKTERESVIRALADCSNTRTWNLLIDMVAQVGKYPSSASSLDNFLVEGERHYWLHVAIDRYTGKIVDKQLEIVRE